LHQAQQSRARMRYMPKRGSQRWCQRAWAEPATCEGHAMLSPCRLRLSRTRGGEMPSGGGHAAVVCTAEVASGARARSEAGGSGQRCCGSARHRPGSHCACGRVRRRRGLVGADARVGAQRALHQAHAHAEGVGWTAALAAAGVRLEGTRRGQLARALSLHGCPGRRGYDALQRRPRGGGRRRTTTR
jgi:hypothetical protein